MSRFCKVCVSSPEHPTSTRADGKASRKMSKLAQPIAASNQTGVSSSKSCRSGTSAISEAIFTQGPVVSAA